MLIEFLVSKFFFVIPMLVGAAAFLLILRMSMGTGTTRREAREGIKNGNMAMAIYFGLRCIAVGVAVGLFVLAGSSI